jgi:hypothetical protein
MSRRGQAPPPVRVASRHSDEPHQSKIHRRIIAEDLDEVSSDDGRADRNARGKAMPAKSRGRGSDDDGVDRNARVKAMPAKSRGRGTSTKKTPDMRDHFNLVSSGDSRHRHGKDDGEDGELVHGSDYYDSNDDEEEDDEEGEEEDDEDTNEERAREVKMRKGSVRRDVPVRSTPGSKRMKGLPPRPSSSVSAFQSQTTSASQSTTSGSTPRGRSPSPVIDSSLGRSRSSSHDSGPPPQNKDARELFNLKESDAGIDPTLLRCILERIPFASPYALAYWNKSAFKLRRDGKFQYILMNDYMRAIDLELHFKVVYIFMFHLIVADMSLVNPRHLAIHKLTWVADWKCIHPVISTAIQQSAVFKMSDLFLRRIEYFKRYIQDKILKSMPSIHELSMPSTPKARRSRPFRWLTAVHLIQLKVLSDFAYIFIYFTCVFFRRLWMICLRMGSH